MERLKDQKICLIPGSKEGYCWQEKKIIDLGLSCPDFLGLLLHEVAHIGNNPHGNKHNQKWFGEYLSLMRKYMPGIDINKHDKIIQKCYKLKGNTNAKMS